MWLEFKNTSPLLLCNNAHCQNRTVSTRSEETRVTKKVCGASLYGCMFHFLTTVASFPDLRLEQLVLAVNDLMESRIDANLKIVANVLLVNLPEVPREGGTRRFTVSRGVHWSELPTP